MSEVPKRRSPDGRWVLLAAALIGGAACGNGAAIGGGGGEIATGSGGLTIAGSGGDTITGSSDDAAGSPGDDAAAGSGGNTTAGSGGNTTAGSGGSTTAGSGGSTTAGSGGNTTAGSGGSRGSGGSGSGGNTTTGSGGNTTTGSGGSGSGGSGADARPDSGPDASGDPGVCPIPAQAQPADSTHPTTVVGQGSPQSCTGAAFVAAVAKGGVITFDCGPAPLTIALDQTAKIFNNKGPEIVIDGGGKITLSGGNARRILYQNTCDPAQIYTTPHCDNQDHPRLTVQNLTFIDGNARGEKFGGGGAIYAQGGRLKIINARFFHNLCDSEGPDVGGGAVRAFQQFDGQPLYVVGSTFGGPGELGNQGANGGALSSIGVSYSIFNSVFDGNQATGDGGNPALPGTPGGGSGGAIYNDGNTFTLTLCGTRIQNHHARQFGGAVFFVSNNRTGSLVIRDSILRNNVSDDRIADQFPGIFVLARTGPDLAGSIIE